MVELSGPNIADIEHETRFERIEKLDGQFIKLLYEKPLLTMVQTVLAIPHRIRRMEDYATPISTPLQTRARGSLSATKRKTDRWKENKQE